MSINDHHYDLVKSDLAKYILITTKALKVLKTTNEHGWEYDSNRVQLNFDSECTIKPMSLKASLCSRSVADRLPRRILVMRLTGEGVSS